MFHCRTQWRRRHGDIMRMIWGAHDRLNKRADGDIKPKNCKVTSVQELPRRASQAIQLLIVSERTMLTRKY